MLLHVAFGDHQVANVTAEVEARTIGARSHQPALAPGRSPDDPPLWGIPAIGREPYGGSAIVYWDSGVAAPPVGNLPPRDGQDPHEAVRADAVARDQKARFLRSNGVVVDVCDGAPCTAAPVATSYWTTEPPSTAMAWPSTNDAASEHSHAAASPISDGRPRRPSGTPCVIIRSMLASPPMNPSSIGVRVLPGQMQLMRMFCFAYSSAAARVMPTTPCLLAT